MAPFRPSLRWSIVLLAIVLGCGAYFLALKRPRAGSEVQAPAPASVPSPTLLASLRQRIDEAVALRTRRQQAEGIQRLEQIRGDAQVANAPALAALALHRKGDLLHDLGQNAEAEAAYLGALKEHQARGDLVMVGRAASDLGILKNELGDKAAAEHWYRESRAARLKSGDKAELRKADNNLAILFFYDSRFDEAEPLYLEGAAAAEEIGDDEGIFKMHGNLAFFYAIRAEGGFSSEIGDVPMLDPSSESVKKAREHFSKALDAGERIGRTEDDACDMLGGFEDRCEWLIPSRTPEQGLARFYVGKLPEWTSTYESARQDRAHLGKGASAQEREDADLEVLTSRTALAAGLLRAADSLRVAGTLDLPSAESSEQYEARARRLFTESTRQLKPQSPGVSKLCSLYPAFAELCVRFGPSARKKH
jgi:hypothetical protein